MDHLIISSYFIITALVGLKYRSKSNNLDSFTNLGSDFNNNKLILTATIFASAVGGGTTFGISEKSYISNLSFAYALILTIPIDILIAKFLVPKLVEYKNFSSPGEILGKYYGKNARVITGISSFLISIGYLSVQISVSGRIFSYIIGIDYIYAVLCSYLLVIFYTSLGGFRAVVVNNLFQFFAMIIAIPALSILCINFLGIEYIISNIDSSKYDIINNNQLFWETIFASLTFSVMGLHPSFIQRIISGSSSSPIKNAIYIKTVIYFFFIICIGFNGLISTLIDSSLNANHALLILIDIVIPAGLKGLVIVGLLASVMSTADSDLNTSSICFVNDFLKPLFNYHSKHMILLTKIFTIIIGSSVILIVLKFDNIIDIIIFSAGFWAPVSLIPMIYVLRGYKINNRNYYLSIILGILSFSIIELKIITCPINGAFIGCLASYLTYFFSNKIKI